MGRIADQASLIYKLAVSLISNYTKNSYPINGKDVNMKYKFFEAKIRSNVAITGKQFYEPDTVKLMNPLHDKHYLNLKNEINKFSKLFYSNASTQDDNLEVNCANALGISYDVISSPLNSHFSGVHSIGVMPFNFVISNKNRLNSLELIKIRHQRNDEYNRMHFGDQDVSNSPDVLNHFDVDSPKASDGTFSQLKSFYYYWNIFSTSKIKVLHPSIRGSRSDIIFSDGDKQIYGDIKRLLKPLTYEMEDGRVYAYVNSGTKRINDIFDVNYIARKMGEVWDKDSYPSENHVLMLVVDGYPVDLSELRVVKEFQEFLNKYALPQIKVQFPNIPVMAKVAISYVGAVPPGTDEAFISEVNEFNTLFVKEGFSDSYTIEGPDHVCSKLFLKLKE